MHDVRIDSGKNRIYITIGSLENEAEMKKIVKSVKAECQKLRDGFTCVTDLRDYEFQDEVFERYIKEAQQALVAAGLFKVVRVHRKFGAIGHFQFDNTSFEVGYHADSATSIEAAEKILDDTVAERDAGK